MYPPQIKKNYDVNVFGVLSVTRAFLPLLRANGPGARIINISSISGRVAGLGVAIYASTSAGPLCVCVSAQLTALFALCAQSLRWRRSRTACARSCTWYGHGAGS